MGFLRRSWEDLAQLKVSGCSSREGRISEAFKETSTKVSGRRIKYLWCRDLVMNGKGCADF